MWETWFSEKAAKQKLCKLKDNSVKFVYGVGWELSLIFIGEGFL